MSDFEDDIDDQLLELAGATEKKKKRRQPGASGTAGGSGERKSAGGGKKRKAERMETDSEKDAVESEEEAEDPYPLEGKYKDEQDKRELLSMSEFRREQILEERSEEKQKLVNARMLADMVRQQQRGGGANTDDSHHAARGATKEKTHKLDELKAKRKAKDDKKRSRPDASPSRDRSSSPQDMDISDSDSEDGQISKTEQEEERLLSLGGYDSHKKARLAAKEDAKDVPSTRSDLETCRLSRDDIAKHCIKPWFQDYVTGAWVRYLIGQEANGGPVYRICQISDLAPDFVKPYKINDKTVNQAFELKHGKSTKIFNMDKVSNSAFCDKEFDRLVKVCSTEDVKLPTKQALEKKAAQLQKLVTQPMTESDINAMLLRKSQLQASLPTTGISTLERSRLIQQRTMASRRQDHAEVAEIDAKLEMAKIQEPARPESGIDLLAKVNERNRKANMEAVRKAEIAESERKRRERKLAQNGGPTTPSDPSARLKTLPRTFNSNTPSTTRPGTPAANDNTAHVAKSSISALAASAGQAPGASTSSFEDSLINNVEIDLGDF